MIVKEFNHSINVVDISSLPGGTYVVKLIGEMNIAINILLKE